MSTEPIDPAPIRSWAKELGFSDCRIAAPHLPIEDEERLLDWLRQQRHGEMHFMARHGRKRARPKQLFPDAQAIIVVRMDHFPATSAAQQAVLAEPSRGYVARYALGRDYHKVLRQRLALLGQRIAQEYSSHGPISHRTFVDSAPVLERALARQAGIGWVGKNTQLICKDAGSYCLLGELFVSLPLAPDSPVSNHCGSCRACLHNCPSQALLSPYQLDARRCVSYLTIEHPGSIPEELRPAIGNRIFGCDSCQQVCPWNHQTAQTALDDFQPRHGLDNALLAHLFEWDEATFLDRTAGMVIRRAGYERWRRNLAVALGNCAPSAESVSALNSGLSDPSAVVREHVRWALERLGHG
ncbi:epoxyqueuosine (oQ) reductase QueG [Halorhodospira halochloris]|uniref:Epoxyqueuosine reductase n=1 Tax=Halorhodospira halochloris TaxID=1052 RepID=A0A0X8X7X7_HALHR|nr:tRNA epoxyqueuosine(34) reductase QueG [Halorhodospira halochloris]MBK1651550.1 tRNA epoxyqueuosine(34) reductase QueG [Halorhodospira halochloris]BAU57185.1 epoxyqueuosine (oQ) reductase QueG [Halorhodospira halochloris]